MTLRATIVELLDMEHMDLNNTYTSTEQTEMLQIAAESIHYGLLNHEPVFIDQTQYSERLSENRATFVTLEISNHLRGCIGALEAYRPLAQDISANAYAAAFKDPRFNPLSETEYALLNIHISILSPPEKMHFESEESLLSQIQTGKDGLIITDKGHRATFLPSVWESLPNKSAFLSELKQKAGLGKNYWSNSIQVEKYSAYSFGSLVSSLNN